MSNNPFESYRRAKEYHGGRLDNRSTPSGWVLVGLVAAGVLLAWWYGYRGYSRWAQEVGKPAGESVRGVASTPLNPTGDDSPRPGLVFRERNPDETAVVFFDVGQGDAIFIRTPHKTNLLVDTGRGGRARYHRSSRDMARERILPFFRRNRVRRLDYLITTHPQSDHIGAAPTLLYGMPVGQVWVAGRHHPTPTRRSLLEALRLTFTPLRAPVGAGGTLRVGDRLELGPGPAMWLLRDDPDAPTVNDASLVLLLRYGTTELLLTGDIEADAEEELVRRWGHRLRAEILKVAHHGSRTSTTPHFLRFVKPEHAVIQVGRHNPFGHPDSRVLKRLRSVGARIHRTDRDGAVFMFLDGRTIEVRKPTGSPTRGPGRSPGTD